MSKNKKAIRISYHGGTLSKDYIISVDMGGTKILGCLLNSDEGIIARAKIPTKIGGKTSGYVHSLKEVVDAVIEQAGLKKERIKAVCLGVPGSVDPYTGRIGLAPNIGLKNIFIKDKLQEIIPYPVLVENDVNIGALGIKRFGVGKKAKNMLAVFVGTGIGGALILDEKIYRGSTFVAGEIGHMIVEEGGPLCGCGHYGCFEAVASRTAIANNILKDMKKQKKSFLKKIVKPGQRIKSGALAAAVEAKDKVVIKNLSDACRTIGLVLANVSNLMNVDMIVLGGGLIEALDYFMLPIIKKSYKQFVLKESSRGVKIVESDLGDEAAIFGGIPLAEEFLGIKV
ncbi:MAG TPA: ROK family protein [Ignavibacteriaceae bacterium]|nr:ROK family protein [Ignavibacteriaceae bacterium]